MLDIERMKKSEMVGQFFAIFFPPKTDDMPEDDIYFEKAREILFHTIENHSESINFFYHAHVRGDHTSHLDYKITDSLNSPLQNYLYWNVEKKKS